MNLISFILTIILPLFLIFPIVYFILKNTLLSYIFLGLCLLIFLLNSFYNPSERFISLLLAWFTVILILIVYKEKKKQKLNDI